LHEDRAKKNEHDRRPVFAQTLDRKKTPPFPPQAHVFKKENGRSLNEQLLKITDLQSRKLGPFFFLFFSLPGYP